MRPWGCRVLGDSVPHGAGNCAFFCFCNEKVPLHSPPIISLSNMENSQNCHSSFSQNVKIKEKSFVIPVHLLSKYTVIRASYVICSESWTTLWFCLLHPWRPWEFLALSFLFVQLYPNTCSKAIERLDWILILNFQLTSNNIKYLRYNTLQYKNWSFCVELYHKTCHNLVRTVYLKGILSLVQEDQ